MSEDRDVDPGDDAEIEDSEVEQEEPESEEEGEPPAKAVDYEKKAHSYAGQAARERSRRQAAERRSAELEGRLEALESRAGGNRDELIELIASLPQTEDDPVGDILRVKNALRMYAQREYTGTIESREQAKAVRQIETLKSAMADAENDYVAEQPDYRDAAAFYRKERAEELAEQGYTGDALTNKLAQDLFGLVQTSFSAGLDPAERVYKLAVKRGFKAGGKQADKKLDAFDRAAASGIRPQARGQANVLSWGDVAKLDGAARDKAWAALRKREMSRK
jgi:hypothetical protein